MSVADYHVRDRQDVAIKKKKRHEKKNRIPTLKPSMFCRTDWSVMRREERICSRTGGEQKVKAEGRTGWREGGEEREQERERERERGEGGGLLLPLHNEWGEKSHICCGGFIHLILLHVGAPTSLCTQNCPAILVGTYCVFMCKSLIYMHPVEANNNNQIPKNVQNTQKCVILVQAASVWFFCISFSVCVCIITRWV